MFLLLPTTGRTQESANGQHRITLNTQQREHGASSVSRSGNRGTSSLVVLGHGVLIVLVAQSPDIVGGGGRPTAHLNMSLSCFTHVLRNVLRVPRNLGKA